ncbi:response regulator transcription factor [Mumia zhuanghuii]|uniref:Response regulator n=2 Tax=Mumia TaxID=1546255 RepID=A0ABW1QG78_9ACTN|nr:MULTISPECIES: response regulator transcription factor [Mumia]KAA1422847.1 response regulator transcription factor [Mumia zhuanghuii]
MIRVALVDDQELVRDGFRAILELEPDITVVGEAADGVEALALIRATAPDVVLLDVRMPRLDGIGVLRRLSATPSATRVLVLTTFDLDDDVSSAFAAGASGFLVKNCGRAALVEAVRAVVTGDELVAPQLTRRLIERFIATTGSTVPDARVEALSNREREVLVLIARGMSNAEIADALFVSTGTVKTYVARLLPKLGARDRLQAAVLAYELGLVRPGGRDVAGLR